MVSWVGESFSKPTKVTVFLVSPTTIQAYFERGFGRDIYADSNRTPWTGDELGIRYQFEGMNRSRPYPWGPTLNETGIWTAAVEYKDG